MFNLMIIQFMRISVEGVRGHKPPVWLQRHTQPRVKLCKLAHAPSYTI